MAADADVRSSAGSEGRERSEGPDPALLGDAAPSGAPDQGDRVVVRLALAADALEHLDPDGPLDADAARELAAVLDSYAAAQDARD